MPQTTTHTHRPLEPPRAAARWPSVALLVATLCLIELCLRVLAGLPTENPVIAAIRACTSLAFRDEDFAWKQRFLDLYDQDSEKTIPISQREYRVDPELGWVPREDVQLTNERSLRFTTNSLGFRARHEYEVDDDARFTVLILGDSFTYGSGADDAEVWPTLLQGLDERLQVLNMAVGGYGTDQMYLMLNRYIARFRPDLVITAFIDNDLRRSTLAFRDYQKPKFAIEAGTLVLTNTPIPDLEAVARRVHREVESRHPLTRVKLVNLVLNSYASLTKMTRDEALWAINDRIFGEMLRLCNTHDAAFLLLYLPRGSELTDPAFESYGEAYFEDFVARTGVESLNPRPLFLASEARHSPGHYRKPGATLVARTVYEKITTLPAFDAFIQQTVSDEME